MPFLQIDLIDETNWSTNGEEVVTGKYDYRNSTSEEDTQTTLSLVCLGKLKI